MSQAWGLFQMPKMPLKHWEWHSKLALYQPDIAPNAAAIARMCACFGLKLTIIEPAGFVLS